MEDKKHEEEINGILNLLFNKYNQNKGYEKLEEHLIKEEKNPILCVKNILLKISKEPWKQNLMRDGNSIKIYFSLFKILKKALIYLDNNIFFVIIESVFIIELKELNKINIIVEIIKGEKIFILKHFDKLLNRIVIPLLLKEEIKHRNEGYYLDQVIKAGIGCLFQKNYNGISLNSPKKINRIIQRFEDQLNSDEINIGFDRIYKYLIDNLSQNNAHQKNFLIISWFNFLESIPGNNLTNHYYKIIIKLLKIINSNNKEASELAELYLKKIIKDIISSYNEKELEYIKDILKLIIKNGDSENNKNNEHFNLILFELLNEFLEKFESLLNNENHIENLKKKIPFDLYPEILKFILMNLINLNRKSQANESNEKSNINQIIKSNSIFSNLMKKVKPEYFEQNNKINDTFVFEGVIYGLLINNLNEKSTNLIFDWISQLYASKLFQHDEFLKNLIIEMKNLREYHIKRIIGVMHMIKDKSTDFNQEIIINKILEKFNNNEFVEKYGLFILNELSDESNKTIDLIEIFKEIGKYLDKSLDIFFVSNIIDMLTKYLIKEKNAKKVLDALNSDKKFFTTIYKVFCFNPFDTLVLLLLTKKFELSYFFVLNLSRMELETLDLIELSKAVQVFESFYFIDVRIQLLNPKSNIYLTKTLYAISLLLPPGPALEALSHRLKCLEILYDFDEEEKNKVNIESNNNNINNYDSSKPINESEEINSLPNLSKEISDELFKYMDENEKVFFQKQIKEYITIFEEQTIKTKKFMKK